MKIALSPWEKDRQLYVRIEKDQLLLTARRVLPDGQIVMDNTIQISQMALRSVLPELCLYVGVMTPPRDPALLQEAATWLSAYVEDNPIRYHADKQAILQLIGDLQYEAQRMEKSRENRPTQKRRFRNPRLRQSKDQG